MRELYARACSPKGRRLTWPEGVWAAFLVDVGGVAGTGLGRLVCEGKLSPSSAAQ